MKEKVDYQYDKKGDTVKVTINIRKGFFNTIGYFFFILSLPVGLIFAYILLLGMFRGIVLSMNYILLFSFLAIINIFAGAMSLCHWLNYNFGKEILILNNKDKYLEYNQLFFGVVKTKKFNYCDFLKIILDRDFGRNPDYYFSLECGHKKCKLGIVNDSIEGIDIVEKVSNFIIK